jgi:hypothetical protein
VGDLLSKSFSSFDEEFSCSLVKFESLGRVCGRSYIIPLFPLRRRSFSVRFAVGELGATNKMNSLFVRNSSID